MKSLDSWPDLPLDPQIAYFVFLPFITFILAFTTLECIKRYWETICEETR